MTAVEDRAVAAIRRWRADPAAFVREEFGTEPDAWQVDVLRAFATKQRVAMKAAKGCGKSALLAWCIWNFLATRSDPRIACVSISADNLRDGLWAELALWRGKSAFLGAAFDQRAERIVSRERPETWWASARAWSQSADAQTQANTLAGLHAQSVLFVLDEAGGIPDAVMAAAEAGLSTGGDTKLLIAGNPTNLDGPLYRAATSERHLWYLSEITGDPDAPNRSPRISVQWAREQIAKYGADNPWVLVNVFGKFPPTSSNALLGPDDVTACMQRVLPLGAIDGQARTIGIDPARFGDDPTVVIERQGRWVASVKSMRGARTGTIAGYVAGLHHANPADAIFIDSTGGYSAGIEDALLDGGLHVVPVNFSERANDEGYFNKRSEIWWLMAEWCKTGGKLPNEPGLVRELCEPTYFYQSNKIRLEEKEQIKARLGWSPNIADAIATTFAMPVIARKGQQHRSTVPSVSDYDPMREMRGR